MFKRKSIPMLLVGLFALAGCTGGGSGKDKVRLQVWGPADEEALYIKHAAEFQALNPDIEFIIRYADVGEPDAATLLLQDQDTGADVFFYADDQTSKLVAKEVLAVLPDGYKNKVMERDSVAAIEAATSSVDEKLYAFPVTADNGYFLVYNNEYFTEEDVLTLEGILAKATEDHQFVMDMGNGYYATAFLQHISNITYNPLTELHDTDFNSAASIDAMEGLIDLLRPNLDGKFLSEDFNGPALNELSDANNNKVVAGVTGHWNTGTILEILGEKFSATKLPSFKSKSGVDVQMGAFAGSKLVGVKASSLHLNYALAFADYITNEAAQTYRFEQKAWGPSNKNVQQLDAVQANPGLAGLAAQAPFAISQAKSVGGTFWDAAANVGNFVLNGPASDTAPQTPKATLDAFVAALSTPTTA